MSETIPSGFPTRTETLLRAADRAKTATALDPISGALAQVFEQATEDIETCDSATENDHLCRYCREDEWPAVIELADTILSTY